MASLPDLIKLQLRAAWRRRWVAILAAWVTCIAGWTFLAYVPDQFESSARLYVDSDAILVPLLRGIAVDTGTANQADLMQKTLLSPSNLDKLIVMTSLQSSVSNAEERERLNRRLSLAIHIISHERNLFTVTYRDTDPVLARDVVQAALSVFLQNQTGTSRTEMENAQHFLRDQIASYKRQLTETENRRAAFRARYFDLLPSAGSTASRLQSARAALAAAETEREDTRTRLDALKKQLDGIPQLMTVDATSPATIAGAALAGVPLKEPPLAEAERTLTTLRLRFTDAHPDVIAARKLVAALSQNPNEPNNGAAGPAPKASISNPVYEQVRLRIVDLATNLASIEQKTQAQQAEVTRLEALAREAPGVEAEYERLDRDYTILKKNHDELVTRLEAAKLASAADSSADSKVRIVEAPRIAKVPVAPKRSMLALGVLCAGLGAAGAIVFLLQRLDHSFSSIQQLRGLGLPVLGSISSNAKVSLLQPTWDVLGFAISAALLFLICGTLALRAAGMNFSI